MSPDAPEADPIGGLLETPDLAGALESDRFKQFLDHVPVAIAVAALGPEEHVVYANREFERLIGRSAADLVGKAWRLLPGVAAEANDRKPLGVAIAEDCDYVGVFELEAEGGILSVDAWSNIIEDDDGTPVFRLAALLETARPSDSGLSALEEQVEAKDLQLRELQHRVKNNLQMITALIRAEARGAHGESTGARFVRLAGRIEALGLLYRSLTEGRADSVDLGAYLSEIASAVMRAHATEGVHLNLNVDSWPVSVDVAMPAGLVVNELLTNSLKHAFEGREGGTITLNCLADPRGFTVVVADDGVGLPPGAEWPGPGKMSALIVRSLRQNAKADIEVESKPGEGVRVSIIFAREDAAPPD